MNQQQALDTVAKRCTGYESWDALLVNCKEGTAEIVVLASPRLYTAAAESLEGHPDLKLSDTPYGENCFKLELKHPTRPRTVYTTSTQERTSR